MYLKRISMKGFKSFPDRTRLEFGPGTSVIVGPNGSGKSNVTDAVLWALGEQSPMAIRGHSMQDVIFGGAPGRQAASGAEVELVLDDEDNRLGLGPEVSILRRLDRNGEGEYRLGGARCRLIDVIEVLSDTGLGKEMHSVISQGRVEAIVTSKPKDRRRLIEEAAGLGKHRKRRRRAQIKLDHTQDNLDRALDVEREARSRLKPLKRQAEAAELHERLHRQTLEVRWELARDELRERRAHLASAAALAARARTDRCELEQQLEAVGSKRREAEEALAARSSQREELQRRSYAAQSAGERIGYRADAVKNAAETVASRLERSTERLQALRTEHQADQPDPEAQARVDAITRELEALDRDREAELARQLAELEQQRVAAQELETQRAAEVDAAQQAREQAEQAYEAARTAVREAEREVDAARRESARVGGELAAVNQFLRSHQGAPGGGRSLADALTVASGFELAVAAALDGRLGAAVVSTISEAAALLDRAGRDGGRVLLLDAVAGAVAAGTADAFTARAATADAATADAATADAATADAATADAATADAATADAATADAATADETTADETTADETTADAATADETTADAATADAATADSSVPPAAGSLRLAERVSGEDASAQLARELLRDAWVVDDIDAVRAEFSGIAVTRSGRVFTPLARELRQTGAVGEERVLAERNRRDELVAASEAAVQAEHRKRAAVEVAAAHARELEGDRERAIAAHRATINARDEAAEQQRRLVAAINRRRAAPDEGPSASRSAELKAELRAEQARGERAEQTRRERAQQIRHLQARIERDEQLGPEIEAIRAALSEVVAQIGARRSEFDAALAADREAGEHLAAALRETARQEAELQSRLNAAGEALTRAEVTSQRAEDQARDAELALTELASELELEPAPAEQPLPDEERSTLRTRLERLARRREQLGPVNPLAQAEYAEALAHVEELEAQRGDLEAALRELQTLIKDTDKQIRETFEETFAAAAKNFEELAPKVFPGGSGRLRLVSESEGQAPVIGGQKLDRDDAAAAAEAADEASGEDASGEPGAEEPDEDVLGVEIEITPAGKAMKRLTLLSGGEKAMTALAFLFAVFLAKPCPFYILDEVEAALDDLNITRFLDLLDTYSSTAQFIVVTHQKRTMEAADSLYGVSMGGDGISKVISRRLPTREAEAA